MKGAYVTQAGGGGALGSAGRCAIAQSRLKFKTKNVKPNKKTNRILFLIGLFLTFFVTTQVPKDRHDFVIPAEAGIQV